MSRRESRSSLGARQNDALFEFENFKKKFLLANKHITKLNATLSVRIEELNAQISLLHVENLRLRESEIALTAQLKRARGQKGTADPKTRTQNLAKHLIYPRETHNIRTTSIEPPTQPSPSAQRLTLDIRPSPTSPQLKSRISRPPNVPGIHEEDEPSGSSDEVEKQVTPSRTKSKSKPRLSASKPSPTPAIATTTANEAISASSKPRKTILRQNGLLSVNTKALSVPRSGSPAFGPKIRLEAGRAEEAEEFAAVHGELEVTITTVGDVLAKREKRKGKAKEEAETGILWKSSLDKKRLREEVDSTDILKPKVKDTTVPRTVLQPIDSNVYEQVDSNGKAFLRPGSPDGGSAPTSRGSTIPVTGSSELEGAQSMTGHLERRTRRSVNYAEPKLNTLTWVHYTIRKMRKPENIPKPKVKDTTVPRTILHTIVSNDSAGNVFIRPGSPDGSESSSCGSPSPDTTGCSEQEGTRSTTGNRERRRQKSVNYAELKQNITDSEDNITDAPKVRNKLLNSDSPLESDAPINGNPYALPLQESTASSFLESLSSVITEDLTGFIARDSEYPAHGGGYADVYIGTLSKEQKRTMVAIKIIRTHTYTPSNRWKIEKRLRREIRLWSCLRHPNVVPLLGTTLSFSSYTSMVCPWMNEGNLHHYLDDRRAELNLRRRLQIAPSQRSFSTNVFIDDLIKSLADVVEGLSYLHLQQVIHGDLTTGNILMDGGKAHLSDFGLSNVMAEVRNNSFLSSTVGGAPRWTAPELLHVGTDVNKVPTVTKECDIYSFGSVVLQVISGRIPYEDILSDIHVILQLINGGDPPRPAEPLLSDGFWDFIVLCWSRNPFMRPQIDQVREMLHMLRYSCSEETLAANVIDYDKSPEKDTVEDTE
ncbi:LOW QUALITY PROTEIN: hypothetical protein CVT25_000985 [Psilocybe cyanescens]|uniref:Protein kinase domain-containing protein n=1 Tax=Psilocybe cyanescens TaxID=93625 RepID=A0A409XMD2_PSICY|nr:LOW QUALITY PROTEIN: hypothetical protein CVT25_000985 [Psilocybe cyanescens]